MKKIHIIILIFLIGILCWFIVSKSNKPSPDLEKSEPDVRISILNDFTGELKWSEIKSMLIPLSEMGLCNVEINGFLIELPSLDGHTPARDDDPLLLDGDMQKRDLKKLQAWSQKYCGDEVEVSFGESVNFNVVKHVITILRENKIEIRLKEKREVGSSEIKLSLFGGFTVLELHNQVMDPTRENAQSVVSKFDSRAGHN